MDEASIEACVKQLHGLGLSGVLSGEDRVWWIVDDESAAADTRRLADCKSILQQLGIDRAAFTKVFGLGPRMFTSFFKNSRLS